MSKVKSAFFCQSCGYETPKWLGKCPGCSSWNSFVEELKQKKGSTAPFSKNSTDAKPVPLKDIKENIKQKTELQDKELNRVLGGGIVLGSLVLVGGDPGIGKSTLMLQLAIKENLKVLYVSGEESENQIKMRAERIGILNESCHILTETNLEAILTHANQIDPQISVSYTHLTLPTKRLV